MVDKSPETPSYLARAITAHYKSLCSWLPSSRDTGSASHDTGRQMPGTGSTTVQCLSWVTPSQPRGGTVSSISWYFLSTKVHVSIVCGTVFVGKLLWWFWVSRNPYFSEMKNHLAITPTSLSFLMYFGPCIRHAKQDCLCWNSHCPQFSGEHSNMTVSQRHNYSVLYCIELFIFCMYLSIVSHVKNCFVEIVFPTVPNFQGKWHWHRTVSWIFLSLLFRFKVI